MNTLDTDQATLDRPCSCPHFRVTHEQDCAWAANERREWGRSIDRMLLWLVTT